MCSGMKGLALVRDRTGLDRNRAIPKSGISSTLLFCLVESARCGLRASTTRQYRESERFRRTGRVRGPTAPLRDRRHLCPRRHCSKCRWRVLAGGTRIGEAEGCPRPQRLDPSDYAHGRRPGAVCSGWLNYGNWAICHKLIRSAVGHASRKPRIMYYFEISTSAPMDGFPGTVHVLRVLQDARKALKNIGLRCASVTEPEREFRSSPYLKKIPPSVLFQRT